MCLGHISNILHIGVYKFGVKFIEYLALKKTMNFFTNLLAYAVGMGYQLLV